MRRNATLSEKFFQGSYIGNTLVFSVALRRNVAKRRTLVKYPVILISIKIINHKRNWRQISYSTCLQSIKKSMKSKREMNEFFLFRNKIFSIVYNELVLNLHAESMFKREDHCRTFKRAC
jgi:hypothetical protein